MTLVDLASEARLIAAGVRYAAAWRGKTVVVKYGGSVMDAGAAGTVIEDLVLLKAAGIHPVLVHGGGPEITRMLERVGKPTRFVDGLRVTDEETMEIVEMVLAGRANKALVTLIGQAGGSAVGVSGKDAGLLRARRWEGAADLGLVGEVVEVRADLLRTLSEAGHIPVVASLGLGPGGESLNLNADHAAAALAAAVGASKLIILTDVPGVMRTRDGTPALISSLTAAEARALIADGTVSRGMIPKVEACLMTLERGVPSAHIIGTEAPHALLLELFTEEGIGTMITGGGR
ncbi:MAG: acetylglutamate kinase [Armatimonadota bacterium]|nr:acetylglutamate kinase [Armatimonadota bacterium]MDR7533326.1 acetylglutamate kinase [Armatimonadota bacterium]MDR7536555.1 acetylglutamate kinase [Armatimonadota bacterium]